jgi:hypothetical protein
MHTTLVTIFLVELESQQFSVIRQAVKEWVDVGMLLYATSRSLASIIGHAIYALPFLACT